MANEIKSLVRQYGDDDIVSIRSDRDRVRKRPGLYIPSTHADGALHCIREIVDNGLDELSTKGSVGHVVEVTYDKATYECLVTDDGAGVPHGSMLDAFTVLATSGKFDNTDNTAFQQSIGSFGHGSKIVVFLSKACRVKSSRDGKFLQYSFKDGILDDTKKGKSSSHGTEVQFTLDKDFVAVDELDPKDLEDLLKEKSFCYPDLTITYTLLENGAKVKTVKFEGNTFTDLTRSMRPDTEIIEIHDTRKVRLLKNFTDIDISEINVDVDMAIAFSEKALDMDTDAMVVTFANGTKLYSNGTPLDGVKAGLVKYFREVAIPKLPKKEQELQITPGDITAGLCGAISVRLNRPEFSAQYKTKLTNPEAKTATRDAVFEALSKSKGGAASQMMKFIIRVTRGRMASKKNRRKDVDNAFSKDYDVKYTPIRYTSKTTHPMLLLVEGDSAAGIANSTRDAENQAVFGIKKPKNVFDADSETMSQYSTSVFNDVCDKANITPGKKCDASKCVFDEINALTDGDTDGHEIAIALFALFWRHARPIIDAGILGRIIPPAYSYTDKKGKVGYIRSKRELFDRVMSKMAGDTKVRIGNHEMSRDELLEFLNLNFDYPTELESVADWHYCDPVLMEYIAWNYHGDWADQKAARWKKIISKRGYDLIVKEEGGNVVITGKLPGYEYINVAFDETLDKHLKAFKKIQSMNDNIDGYFMDDEPKTLYGVMSKIRKYMPRDITRFKGLGEMDKKEFREICMDMNGRTRIVMKAGDFDDDFRKIAIIMSTRDMWQRARVELLSNISVASRDLDT